MYPTRLGRVTIRDLIIRINIGDTQAMKLLIMHFSLVSFFSSSFGPNTFPFTLTLF
jgi:hypothetical protein